MCCKCRNSLHVYNKLHPRPSHHVIPSCPSLALDIFVFVLSPSICQHTMVMHELLAPFLGGVQGWTGKGRPLRPGTKVPARPTPVMVQSAVGTPAHPSQIAGTFSPPFGAGDSAPPQVASTPLQAVPSTSYPAVVSHYYYLCCKSVVAFANLSRLSSTPPLPGGKGASPPPPPGLYPPLSFSSPSPAFSHTK
jgi:hypothetical protein